MMASFRKIGALQQLIIYLSVHVKIDGRLFTGDCLDGADGPLSRRAVQRRHERIDGFPFRQVQRLGQILRLAAVGETYLEVHRMRTDIVGRSRNGNSDLDLLISRCVLRCVYGKTGHLVRQHRIHLRLAGMKRVRDRPAGA